MLLDFFAGSEGVLAQVLAVRRLRSPDRSVLLIIGRKSDRSLQLPKNLNLRLNPVSGL